MATPEVPASAAGPPGPRRSLLYNTGAAVLGTGAFHFAQLALLALLAKRAGPDVQGVYLLALAVATPVLLLFGLELRGALVADATREFSLRSYLALRRVLVALAGGVLSLWLLAYAAGGVAPWAVGLAAGVCLYRMAWTLTEVPWGLEQRHERLDRLAASTAARGLALLLPPALLLTASPPGLVSAPAAAALGVGLGAGLSFLLLLAWDRPRSVSLEPLGVTSAAEIARLARRALPLGLVALAVNLCDSVPRWLVAAHPGGTTHLAHFGSLAYVTLAGNLVILQAVAAASSRLSASYGLDRRAFLHLTARLLLGAALLGGGLLLTVAVCGAWLLRTLFRPEYAAFQPEFLIVAGAHALALLTNVLGSATTLMRRFWLQVPVQGLTLLATVAAGCWLIPGDPVRGAAQTALVRAVVQFGLYAACFAGGLRRSPQQRPRGEGAQPPDAERASHETISFAGRRGRRGSNPQPPP